MIRQEYVEQLKETRDGWEGWGSSAVRNAGPEIVRWLNKQKHIHTVLDFGCGNGVLGPYVRQHCDRSIVWHEYDPSVAGKDSIPRGSFDAIVSVDVLEHVEPSSLDETLAWIREHSNRQYHHIDCNETTDTLPDGRDVHLIVREPEWWEEQLAPPAHGWMIMERHVHDKRKRNRFPRRSCTFVLERQG